MMQLRVVEKGAPGLPGDITVVDGDTVLEGLRNCFRAVMYHPRHTLAVWNGGANMFTQEEHDNLSSLLTAPDLWASTDFYRESMQRDITAIFNDMTCLLGMDRQHPGLQAWQRTTNQIGEALDTLGCVAGYPRLRTAWTLAGPGFHTDFFQRRCYRLLRGIFNGTTRLVGTEDVVWDGFDAPNQHFLMPRNFRPGMDTVWQLAPQAIAVMHPGKAGKNTVHSEHYTDSGAVALGNIAPASISSNPKNMLMEIRPHMRRALEVWDVVMPMVA